MFNWAVELIDKSGYFGVMFGMILENIIPPIPSELIMAFAGASAAKGDLNIFLVIISGVLGSLIGLIPWFAFAHFLGLHRVKKFADDHGRLLTFRAADIDVADRWFEKYGRAAVFFARGVPAVRTFIAIPAALSGMRLRVFMFFALLGSFIYESFFAMIGYTFGSNLPIVERYLDLGTGTVIGIVVLYYLYRVVTFKKTTAERK